MDQTTGSVRRDELLSDDEDQVAISPSGSALTPSWGDHDVLAGEQAETSGARGWGDENLDASASSTPMWSVAGVDRTASSMGVAGVDSTASAYDAAGADATGVTDETEELRAEIERTRSEMSSTIEAIQGKLNPEIIIEQAKDTVREATVGRVEQMVSDAGSTVKETGSNALDIIKQNPLPAAAVGLGLMWLLGRNRGGGQSGVVYYPMPGYDWNRYPGGAQGHAQQQHAPQPSGGNWGQSQNQGPLDQVIDRIRENPVPAAIAGLGLSWLLFGGGNGSGGPQPVREAQYRVGGAVSQAQHKVGDALGEAQERVGDVVGEAQYRVGDAVSQAQDTVGSAVDQVRGTAGQLAHDVQERATELAGQAQETVGQVAYQAQETAGQVAGQAQDIVGQFVEVIRRNPLPAAIGGLSIAWLLMNSGDNRRADHLLYEARRTVGDTVSTAQDTVADLADQTTQQAQQAQNQLQRWMRDNPLGAGLVAAALGAALALALPETPQEHRIMGEARDSLISKAQEVAQDAVERVQHVADEAQRTLREEAEGQGLVPAPPAPDEE